MPSKLIKKCLVFYFSFNCSTTSYFCIYQCFQFFHSINMLHFELFKPILINHTFLHSFLWLSCQFPNLKISLFSCLISFLFILSLLNNNPIFVFINILCNWSYFNLLSEFEAFSRSENFKFLYFHSSHVNRPVAKFCKLRSSSVSAIKSSALLSSWFSSCLLWFPKLPS